ncbi:ribosomal RNA-processing protein 7-domain-containing protein [Geopyxis carbonaria]|nr:ribosomal RNA-processing protein 7-domain-containing protein [Geopyxis carbonaria]
MPKSVPMHLKTHNGYLILPVSLPNSHAFQPADNEKHYLYIRRHSPKVQIGEQDSRSLFLVNIPVDSTVYHIRTLFTDIGGGLVESVIFLDENTSFINKPSLTDSKKRKYSDGVSNPDDKLALIESPWNRQLHKPGTNAIVAFVDRKSCDAALSAVEKCGKSVTATWSDGMRTVPALGSQRYMSFHDLRYPDPAILQASVDSFMADYATEEEEAMRNLARRRKEPDEDGFVKVTRGGGRAAPLTQERAQALLETKRKKEIELKGFYRFQIREERKSRQQDMLVEFEKDKKLVQERKSMRKFKPM